MVICKEPSCVGRHLIVKCPNGLRTGSNAVWIARAWGWVEKAGRGAWLLVLIVSITSLYFTVRNFEMQLGAMRPELTSAGPSARLDSDPGTVFIQWINTGKKEARRGTAALFYSREDGTPADAIATVPITGAGTNVMPGYGGVAKFPVNATKITSGTVLLVCAYYYDEAGMYYAQAFVFRVHARILGEVFNEIDELAPPDRGKCAQRT